MLAGCVGRVGCVAVDVAVDGGAAAVLLWLTVGPADVDDGTPTPLAAPLGAPALLGGRGVDDGAARPVAHPASAHASTPAAARRASTVSTLTHGRRQTAHRVMPGPRRACAVARTYRSRRLP
jgi:hypothetical protein